MVSSLAKGSLGASYMQVPESGTLVHGTPEASVRGKLGLSSLGRVYMGLKLVGLQAPRMMGVISTESCSTECFDLEGNLNQQAVGLLLDESTSPLKWPLDENESFLRSKTWEFTCLHRGVCEPAMWAVSQRCKAESAEWA